MQRTQAAMSDFQDFRDAAASAIEDAICLAEDIAPARGKCEHSHWKSINSLRDAHSRRKMVYRAQEMQYLHKEM